MKTKTMSLIALSLGVCTIVYAAEYKSPDVKFKKATPSYTATKKTEVDDEYKVEGAAYADRGIASEKDTDREPSSLVAAQKKKVEVEEPKNEEKFEPKPWLYKNKLDTAY